MLKKNFFSWKRGLYLHFSTLIDKLSAIFGAMEKNDILTKSEVVSDKASNLLHKLLVRRNNVIACDNRMKKYLFITYN